MNKKILKVIIPILLVVEIFSMFLTYKTFTNKNINEVKEVTVQKEKFAMYVNKNGKYEKYTESNKFPEGYSLNKEKSKCVDNNDNVVEGILSDDGNNITVTSNKTVYCYLYFDEKINYLVHLDENKYFKESEYKDKIKNAYFVNYINTEGALKTYDLSEAKDKSIIGWITNTYDLYIGSESKIRAKDLSDAFSSMSGLEEVTISNLDTSEVTDMNYMFQHCTKLTTIKGLEIFDTSKLTELYYIFWDTKISDISGLKDWNVSNVEIMVGTFMDTQINDLSPLKNWNTSNVIATDLMFRNSKISDITPLKDWDVSNLEETYDMFASCPNLTTVDLNGWNTSNLKYAMTMFKNCPNLTTVDLSRWNTSKLERMDSMFYECANLTTANLSGWDTSQIDHNMGGMETIFYGCSKLTYLDMRNATFTGIPNFNMFMRLSSNIEIIVREDQVDLLRGIFDRMYGKDFATIRTP